jgi:MinD superfamily P-loop ATPase
MRDNIKPNTKFAIIDGSPGIGCPVIASISGVDVVLVVSEPSVSGISDMKRIIKTIDTFHAKICVCINKYDTSIENSNKIVDFCKEKNLPFMGRIPFDPKAITAINSGLTVVDIDCPSGNATRIVYKNTMSFLLMDLDKS